MTELGRGYDTGGAPRTLKDLVCRFRSWSCSPDPREAYGMPDGLPEPPCDAQPMPLRGWKKQHRTKGWFWSKVLDILDD